MKKELMFIIIGGLIVSSLLGLVLFKLTDLNKNYNIGKSDEIEIVDNTVDKLKKQNYEKKLILKGKQLSQKEWNNKKTEKVNQLKQYFADTRDSELLGASNNEIKSLDVKDKSYNEFMDDMNEWLEIAQGENCFKNLDPEGEGILTWDLVESINNKLENNEC